MLNPRVTSGRWYTAAEVRDRANVAVLGTSFANRTGAQVGDQLRLSTGAGPVTVRVVGITGNQAQNGAVVFLPVTTLHAALGTPGAVNQYWVATTSDDHGLIDRTTTRLEDTLRTATRSGRSSTRTPGTSRSRPTARTPQRSRCSGC